MGLPLLGETLQLLLPRYSLDLHPFIRKRIQRYGPIFRSNVAGANTGVLIVTRACWHSKCNWTPRQRHGRAWYDTGVLGLPGASTGVLVVTRACLASWTSKGWHWPAGYGTAVPLFLWSVVI
ncbi:hypothetical protein JCGZ_18827 [Jatropha curcas]|uniref:Uncharacterized protein n=1 Tax=Jatropha curcas TaxID=180498 RepID=A0A067KBP0_JATCU|nr:hypothetical protein JCGZ_18827 [Jatropha curcas]